MRGLLALSAYQFSLPDRLIAQYPTPERGQSRLLLVERKTGKIEEYPFAVLGEMLQEGDGLVFNDTKVIPARLVGRRSSGGKVELFLSRPEPEGTWEVLAKPGRRCRVGERIVIGPDFSAEIIADLVEGKKRVRFMHQRPFYETIDAYGTIPLPHYIRRAPEKDIDKERYQTVYAKHKGAVAAPTAGLHFTQQLLDQMAKKGVEQTTVTLHVGLGTFRPVVTEDITQHTMHSEQVHISEKAATELNNHRPKKKRICVGTTSCRALESAANEKGVITPGTFDTDIFIYPGYGFKVVDALLTNFHLPGSTLLMLVSAFGGYDLLREAYAKAVEKEFRFFSYGDAMLIF